MVTVSLTYNLVILSHLSPALVIPKVVRDLRARKPVDVSISRP